MKKLTKSLFLCSLVFLCFSCQKDTVAEQGLETSGDSDVITLNSGVDSKFKGADVRATLYVDKKRKKYPFIFKSTRGIGKNGIFKFDVYSPNKNIKLHIDQLAFTSFVRLKNGGRSKLAIYLNQKISWGGLHIKFLRNSRYKFRYNQVTIRVIPKHGWIRGRKFPSNKEIGAARWNRGTCGYFSFRIKAYRGNKIITSRKFQYNQMTWDCDRMGIKL